MFSERSLSGLPAGRVLAGTVPGCRRLARRPSRHAARFGGTAYLRGVRHHRPAVRVRTLRTAPSSAIASRGAPLLPASSGLPSGCRQLGLAARVPQIRSGIIRPDYRRLVRRCGVIPLAGPATHPVTIEPAVCPSVHTNGLTAPSWRRCCRRSRFVVVVVAVVLAFVFIVFCCFFRVVAPGEMKAPLPPCRLIEVGAEAEGRAKEGGGIRK